MRWLSKALILGTAPTVYHKGAFGYIEGDDKVTDLRETAPQPFFSLTKPDYIIMWARTLYAKDNPDEVAEKLKKAANMASDWEVFKSRLEGEVYRAVSYREYSLEREIYYYMVDFGSIEARFSCDMTVYKSATVPDTVLKAKTQALKKYGIPSSFIRLRDFFTGYITVKALEKLSITKVTGEEVNVKLEPKNIEIYVEGELPVSSGEIKALIQAL